MKVPKLEKRYKVYWTYYVSTICQWGKTFEHLDRKTARMLVNKLLWHPITSYVSVSDYEGNWKRFDNQTTMEVLRKRDAFFKKLQEEFGGGEEGLEKSKAFLRRQGDWAITALPVQVRAWIMTMKKKKSMEKAAKLLEERR